MSSARFDAQACADRAAVDVSRPDGATVLCFELKGLSVECVKRAAIKDALRERKAIKVDPFRQGFDHMDKDEVDLNELRLCFQVSNNSRSRLQWRRPSSGRKLRLIFIHTIYSIHLVSFFLQFFLCISIEHCSLRLCLLSRL